MLVYGQEVVSLDEDLLSVIEKEPSSFRSKKSLALKPKKNKIAKDQSPVSCNLIKEKLTHPTVVSKKKDIINESCEWSSFGLNSHILSCLEKLNFSKPTPIQKLVLQETSKDSFDILPDIIGTAPTGSGKTLSFLLPIIQKLLLSNLSAPEMRESKEQIDIITKNDLSPLSFTAEQIENYAQEATLDSSTSTINYDTGMSVKELPYISCLILVPTRELAFQINSIALEFVKDTNVRVSFNIF